MGNSVLMRATHPSKAIKLLMAVFLILGLLPITALTASRAYADNSVTITHGEKIRYAGYSTQSMYADGVPVICAQPSKATPPAGTYTKNYDFIAGIDVGTDVGSEQWRADSIRKIFWMSHTSPGFDASFWPSTWYDGTAMTADRYYVLLHILLSDLYAADWEQATFGCNAQFKSWIKNSVIGYAGPGLPFNEGSCYDKLFSGSGSDVPDDFYVYQLYTGSGTQRVMSHDPYNPKGWIGLAKRSANTDITDGNDCYSLAGAQYGVYDASWNQVDTMTVPEDEGYAYSKELEPGTYYVKELVAPKGYALDEETYTVTVTSKETSWAGDSEGWVNEIPLTDPIWMWVGKIDLDTTTNLPQGSASLEGAEFTIRYYDGYYDTAEPAEASGEPTRSWVFRTDSDGYARASKQYQISGDELYTNDLTGETAIPLGTILIQETKAPAGYVLDDKTVHVRKITTSPVGSTSPVESYNAPIVKEQVVRGGVTIEKRDADSKRNEPQGGASLDVTFEIVNKTGSNVVVNGATYANGEVVLTLQAKDGVAKTASDCLPFGTYSVRETMPGEGYFLTDAAEREFTIDQNNVNVTVYTGDSSFFDEVKRGDLEFVKVDEHTMHRLAGVPFKLTSETTGESHILVTDANGYASTAASWNAHSNKTNGNDKGSDYDDEAGIWFGTAPVDDAKGALPYDTYTLEELPCDANKYLTLITVPHITVTRHNHTVDLGTIDDPKPVDTDPYIGTTASDGLDGDKVAYADPEAVVVDRVSFGNLTPGERYVMRGILMDKETGEPVVDAEGNPVEAEKSFTPREKFGYVDMSYAFDAVAYAGHSVVVFEELLDVEGKLVAEHKDIEDYGQTVVIAKPVIGTTAKDGVDGDKQVVRDPEAKVVDTVSYSNLVPGKEYKLTGVLMDKETGEPLAGADGNPVTAEKTFTPTSASGSVEVEFTFDASVLKAGDELVAFEELTRGEVQVAVHADIDDEGQTVEVEEPGIGTKATDGIDGDKELVAGPEAKVVDTVSYSNLVPGKEYKLTGTLMVKETGEPLAGADGNPITAEKTFTPTSASGSVEVEFTFDASLLAGKETVAFEELTRGEVQVAVHADIDDEGQTVSFAGPEISTQARDGLDGDGYVVADPEAEVVDSIHVSNVVPGHSYKILGLLMDAEAERPLLTVDDEELASDAEALTRKVLALLEGEDGVTVKDLEDLAADYDDVLSVMVKAEAMVKPEDTSASVELRYGLDAGDLAGTKTVAFALLVDAKDGDLIASEVDFGCEDQTCLIIPSEIGTTATDKTDGDHELIESARATIVDRVAYENLIPGKEYTVTGVLMDKETGKVLRVADREVTATKTFVPNAAAGSVDVEFTFNAVGLAGKEIVVFESLEKDGREVAVHADIDDESQTVSVTEAPEGSPLAKTGHDTGVATMLMLLMALFGGVIAQHYRRGDGRASTVADPE